MKITTELLRKILDPEDFTWVKVKAYEQQPGDGVGPFQDDYWTLLAHHKKECEFLFDLIHSLAEYALDSQTRLSIANPILEWKTCKCENPTIVRGAGCSACISCSTCNVFLGCQNSKALFYYESPKPRGEL